MKDKKNIPGQEAHLRMRAEWIAQEKAASSSRNLANLSPEEIRRILHELQVHQIELEMQNEELRRTQVELETERARYFDLYNLAPVGYCTLSEKGLILESNLTAAGLLGVARDALFKKPVSQFILKEDQDIYYLYRRQLFETETPQACDLRMVKADGTIFWTHLSATTTQDNGSVPVCHVAMIDISPQKQAEIKLQYLSMHDAMTGLYNRGYFEESMDRLERGRQFPISILMADVDKLKFINDNQGHAAGDRLLNSVAQLLTASFRAEDVIARIGGDEFAILMPDTTAAEAEAVLLRFRQMLQEYNTTHPETPFQLSCGLSTAETRTSLVKTLRQADAKMYLEKGKA